MVNIRNRPIGIFDSGIGGLTVLREMKRLLPHEDLVYFGDTARVPYGTKSRETVQRYSVQIARFLKTKRIKMLVVACNTASAYSIDVLQKRFSFPVSGVIVSGVKAALSYTRNGRIAVIGTEGTIQSGSYRKALMTRKDVSGGSGAVKYYRGMACPLFVPLVEEGWFDGKITEDIARIYLAAVKNSKCDTLILGCTHYPLLKKIIRKVVGPTVAIVDSAYETAVNVRKILGNKGLLRTRSAKGVQRYYVSDAPEKFCTIGRLFLKEKIRNISLKHLN